jgi:hypothetical protein
MLWRGSLMERAFHDGLPYNGRRHHTAPHNRQPCPPTKCQIEFQNVRRPTAQTLPLISGITAGPAAQRHQHHLAHLASEEYLLCSSQSEFSGLSLDFRIVVAAQICTATIDAKTWG